MKTQLLGGAGEAGALPLPRSKLERVSSQFSNYQIAPLDRVSLVNGVSKFDHTQQPLDRNFPDYAFSFLDALFPLMSINSGETSVENCMTMMQDEDHSEKASGYPWCFLGCPTKAAAAHKFPDFAQYPDSMLNCTLKDEIRPSGKDARLFRPASLHDYFEGLRLFAQSAAYLQRLNFDTPLFTRFIHPGRDVSQVFARIRQFNGCMYDADGSQWDAHFPIILAELIMNWRLRHAPAELHDRICSYYSKMYYGWTNCAGNVIHLEGQPSGHFLTTIDNSLCQIVLMAYHAWRCRMSLRQFHDEVLFYCCGDDLIWADRSGNFTPRDLHDSYAQLGVYLEFGSFEPREFFDLSFVGQTPVLVDNVLRYHGKVDKNQAATEFFRRTSTLADRIQKLALCCLNMRFGPTFDWHRKVFYDFVHASQVLDESILHNRSVQALVALVHPVRSQYQYDRYENGRL